MINFETALSEDMCDGLKDFRFEPIELASAKPTASDAQELALQGVRNWLSRRHKLSFIDGETTTIEHSRNVSSERQQLQSYFEVLDTQAPEYTDFIRTASTTMPPMSPHCRLVVNMPAYREGQSIFDALEHMLINKDTDGAVSLAQRDTGGRPLDPELYEIIIAINRKESETPDDTAESVMAFIDTYKLPVSIQTIDVTLPEGYANNGMTRRILHDVTFMRSLQRTEQDNPLYIAAEDADINGYDNTTFDNFINYLDNHTDKSAARLRTERDIFDIKEIPHLLIKHRFMTMLITALRSAPYGPDNNPNYNFRLNRRVPSGYGTAFVATDIAAAGGFPIVDKSTDLILGENLAALYADSEKHPAHDLVGTVPAIVLSSARREIVSYINQIDPYAGNNFTDSSITELTRLDTTDLIQKAKNKKPAEARLWLEDSINSGLLKLFATAPNRETASQDARRIMSLLGFKKQDYTISEEGVVDVLDWDHIELLASQFEPSRRMYATKFHSSDKQ